ncbi:hypothetical protein EYW48_21415, partial [Vibrio sp. 1180_3]|nr:hypothetical protein [Vibrio sp. 1180_3]
SHNKQFKWILNAWQFYYALSKVFYGAMQRLGQCVVHHLIGRYMLYRFRRRNGYFSRTRNRTSPV